MTKSQRRMLLHESFVALVQTLGEALPAAQRSTAQQQLLEDAEFQVRALRIGQLKLHPTPIKTLQRRKASHQRLLDQLCNAFRTGQVVIRSITP